MPTISSLDHAIPDKNFEEILNKELGNDTNAVINMMSTSNVCHNLRHFNNYNQIVNKSTKSEAKDMKTTSQLVKYEPFHRPVIDDNSKVDVTNIKEMQKTILDNYPNSFFSTYRTAVFHVHSGAKVHTTNDKRDFIVFHPIKTKINLAVGSKAECEGIGAVLTRLNPTAPPVILAPVYYCPHGKISTISPSALKYYNSYIDVTIRIIKSLEYQRLQQESIRILPVKVHHNLDYIGLPILHLSTEAITKHMMASLFQKGLNEQFIHQKFDHRNLDMIIKMKK